jgi:hypothetical protein
MNDRISFFMSYHTRLGLEPEKKRLSAIRILRRATESMACELAPQSGHVSNFCRPVVPLIEPADIHCFQIDSSTPPTLVHRGHPVWTRLELAVFRTHSPEDAPRIWPFAGRKELSGLRPSYSSTWRSSVSVLRWEKQANAAGWSIRT